MPNCEYAYRKNGDVSLHCRILAEQDDRRDWCAHQYLCKRSRMWEASDDAGRCEIREKKK